MSSPIARVAEPTSPTAGRTANSDSANPDLAAHVRRAVDRGDFSAKPFPYLFATDLLPVAFYEQLAAAWPHFDEMSKPNPSIGRIDFPNPPFSPSCTTINQTSLSQDQLRVWATFGELIDGPFFEEAFAKFRPHLPALGRELLAPSALDWRGMMPFSRQPEPDLSFWNNATAADFMVRDRFLTNRKDLSVLAPHVDSIYFNFTLIIYFAADNSHPHLGTTLFKQTGRGRARLPSEIERPYAQYAAMHSISCQEERSLPFLPNAALLFLNGLHSWHGQHLSEVIERKTYNSFFVVAPQHLEKAMRPADIARLREVQLA